MIKVALVSGFWAQNIGNAYFNIGGKWILEQIFGADNVQFIQDQPAYRTFYPQHEGVPKNSARILERLDVDYIVLQGPMLTSTFRDIWGDAFKEYKRRGVKVILLGAAFFKYTEKEIADVKAFLDEYPPAIISTRDSVSYGIVKDWIDFVHDGIDSAFFVPKAFKPIPLLGDYFVFNFDRFPEPSLYFEDKGERKFDKKFVHEDVQWRLRTPLIQNYFAHLGKSQAYIGHLLDFRKLPTRLFEHDIIRPEHRYAPHMTHKIYQHPGAFVSDEPFTYFSVYAGSSLTLADRVHACVMTLAYGNPAMLFTPSPRQALFARLGLHDIRNQPVSLDMDYLEEQRMGVLDFMRSAVEKIEH